SSGMRWGSWGGCQDYADNRVGVKVWRPVVRSRNDMARAFGNTGRGGSILIRSMPLLLAVGDDALPLVGRAVHQAAVIRRHPFRAHRISIRAGNEIFHGAVNAADPDAAAAAGVRCASGLVGGLRVRDIDRVVAIDINSAWPAELFPLGDEFAVGVEYL